MNVRLSRHLPPAAVALGAALFGAPAPAQTPVLATTFPVRPPHAELLRARGVLTDYGRGARFGGFDLRDDATGAVARYAIARRMRIDGVAVRCADPPQPGYEHFVPGPACPDWPRSIVIGRTHVVVTYWKTTDAEGRTGFVGDAIAARR